MVGVGRELKPHPDPTLTLPAWPGTLPAGVGMVPGVTAGRSPGAGGFGHTVWEGPCVTFPSQLIPAPAPKALAKHRGHLGGNQLMQLL